MIDFAIFLTWTLTLRIFPLTNKMIDSTFTLNLIPNYNNKYRERDTNTISNHYINCKAIF